MRRFRGEGGWGVNPQPTGPTDVEIKSQMQRASFAETPKRRKNEADLPDTKIGEAKLDPLSL